MKRIFFAAAAMFLSMSVGNSVKAEDIVILYTNDVHCGVEEGIGYAGLAAYKAAIEQKTPYVTLVDCGDAIQGEYIGLVSEGEDIVDIMNEADYDFAVLGNHEFDYGMDVLEELIGKSNAQYLGCNISYSGNGENPLSAMKAYEIVEYGDVSVAYIGITTPYSITSSTPTYFMEDGTYVYEFADGENGSELYRCVQQYVDECRANGADYVIALTHLGDGEEFGPFSSDALVRATEGIDAVLDGHAHSLLPCWIEKNAAGEDVLISSTGTKLAAIGQLVITEDGNISSGVISHYPDADPEMQRFIDEIQMSYEEELKKEVAVSEIALSGYTEDGIRLVRTRETTIGNFCADAYRVVAGADIGLVNGGGVRADLPKGSITYEDLFAVHPFGNTLCMVEATGQEILDCLEMCCQNVQSEIAEGGNTVGEDGGFQQVSGLKFTIDTSVESSVEVDENGMFLAVNGERRVKEAYVQGKEGTYEPIDPAAVYTVASHNYLLKEGGSGCNMFADNVFVIDEGMQDYQILVTYMEELGGVIGSDYGQTQGRITVK